MKAQLLAILSKQLNSKLFQLPPYFFRPSLHTVVTLGNQLLVEKAVEKMNLRERNNKTH